MNSNTISRIATIVYGLIMVAFSINHFRAGTAMAGYVPSYMPFPTVLVYLTGAGLLLAGIAIAINVKARLAAYLLGAMLLVFALVMHLPHVLNGTDDTGAFYGNFLKDTGLAAAAFFIGSKSR